MDEQAKKLLTHILNNPDFRDRLTQDPVKALAEIDIKLDQKDVPRGGVNLPPDEDIRRILKEGKDDKHPWCQIVQSVIGWEKL